MEHSKEELLELIEFELDQMLLKLKEMNLKIESQTGNLTMLSEVNQFFSYKRSILKNIMG